MRSRTAGVVFAALTLAATPALAAFGPTCPTGGCVYDPLEETFYGTGVFGFDYTVPPSGVSYLWAIDYTSRDPAATLFLTDPNETDVVYTVRTGTGFFTIVDLNPKYRFAETVKPGRTTIAVRAPRQFDFCATPGPVGQTCAADVQIFGNGTELIATGGAPIFVTFSESVVPEPSAWTLLVAGFGLVGWRLWRQVPASRDDLPAEG